jgi:hypothetical protein
MERCIRAGESLRTLPCGHSYHAECIGQWLRNSQKCWSGGLLTSVRAMAAGGGM